MIIFEKNHMYVYNIFFIHTRDIRAEKTSLMKLRNRIYQKKKKLRFHIQSEMQQAFHSKKCDKVIKTSIFSYSLECLLEYLRIQIYCLQNCIFFQIRINQIIFFQLFQIIILLFAKSMNFFL